MKFLVRSWEYRRPRLWMGVRFACGIFNVIIGVLLLAIVHRLGQLTWLAAIPLAGAVLIFWTVYQLQQDSIRRVQELEQSRAQVVDDSAARLRRIERDLHDGAQAQLVAVTMKLGLATKKVGRMIDGTEPVDLDRVMELVAAAHHGAKEAVAELRDLARGIHPPVLDQGLGMRSPTLAARSELRSARSSTCRNARRPRSGPSPVLRRRVAHQRDQAQRCPAGHAGSGARARPAASSGQRRRLRRRPRRGRRRAGRARRPDQHGRRQAGAPQPGRRSLRDHRRTAVPSLIA